MLELQQEPLMMLKQPSGARLLQARSLPFIHPFIQQSFAECVRGTDRRLWVRVLVLVGMLAQLGGQSQTKKERGVTAEEVLGRQ